VPSIDWYWPPLGDVDAVTEQAPERRAVLIDERQKAEEPYRAVLAERPVLRARFDALLDVAQRYAVIREEQARWFTLGWPVMRRCVLRLGEGLSQAGAIDQPEGVFFLTRAELDPQHAGVRRIVEQRRVQWQHERGLVAPLEIGQPPRILEAVLSGVTPSRRATAASGNVIVGQAASPGHARGLVRIVASPEDFAAFKSGEILVARATAPAWTPLFGMPQRWLPMEARSRHTPRWSRANTAFQRSSEPRMPPNACAPVSS
jgi:pyruvate,water dikinase